MSNSYKSIQWNQNKIRYDIALLLSSISFLGLFVCLHVFWYPNATMETIIIRGFGWLALLLLHLILAIGPLSRFSKKFLIILYNRRHLGVTMFIMGLIHGTFSVVNFHALGDMNPIRSIFLSNLRYDSLLYFPYQVPGVIALLILLLLACTSHDFWLRNLGPKVWKSLHMLVYAAYALLIMHVVLGGLQNETSPVIYGMLFSGVVFLCLIHLLAAYKERRKDALNKTALKAWIPVGVVSEIEEDRAKIVVINKKRVAVFRYDDKISAVSNYCRHQGGPLGEGRVIDGCITCPWHGYQYLPVNGQSPPPFTEKIETYKVRLKNGLIEVYAAPNEPGTQTAPAIIKAL